MLRMAVFLSSSLLWGHFVDGWQPDKFDVLGAVIALVGVVVIVWGRRWGI